LFEPLSLGRLSPTTAAIKLRTLLDWRGPIPTFVALADGLVHEVNVLDDLSIEAGAIYIMNRRIWISTISRGSHTPERSS
jgi:hypothetical protein